MSISYQKSFSVVSFLASNNISTHELISNTLSLLEFPLFLSFSSLVVSLGSSTHLVLYSVLTPSPPHSKAAGLYLGSVSLNEGLETQGMWSNHRTHLIYFLSVRDQSLLPDVQCLSKLYLIFFPLFFSYSRA